MARPEDTPSREERLAAKLRENLQRRKARTRALSQADAGEAPRAGGDGIALPKTPSKS